MKTKTFGKVLAIAGAIAAVLAVCTSIYLNPPSAFKAHNLDQKRLVGLQDVSSSINIYYHNRQALPERMDVLVNGDSLSEHPDWTDPVTHLPYEYDVTGKTTYRLCADFAADSDGDNGTYISTFRKHHKGHECFDLEVSKQ